MGERYSGQLIGGPDEGNIITSSVPRFRCEVEYRHWLDGADTPSFVTVVRGVYVWDEAHGIFQWELVR